MPGEAGNMGIIRAAKPRLHQHQRAVWTSPAMGRPDLVHPGKQKGDRPHVLGLAPFQPAPQAITGAMGRHQPVTSTYHKKTMVKYGGIATYTNHLIDR